MLLYNKVLTRIIVFFSDIADKSALSLGLIIHIREAKNLLIFHLLYISSKISLTRGHVLVHIVYKIILFELCCHLILIGIDCL